ncbi:MAG: hypothetical protein RL109_652 [Pseudomonadota bacterium]|jgi:hypothetical protein
MQWMQQAAPVAFLLRYKINTLPLKKLETDHA